MVGRASRVAATLFLFATPGVVSAAEPVAIVYDAVVAGFRGRRSFFAFAEAITNANRYVRERVGAKVSPQATPTPTLTFDDSYGFELGGLEGKCGACSMIGDSRRETGDGSPVLPTCTNRNPIATSATAVKTFGSRKSCR